MHLSKFGKILLLILTLIPVFYVIVFMVVVFSAIFQPANAQQNWIFKNFNVLFVAHAAAMLLMLGTMIFYVIYIFKSNLDQQMKILWFIVIFVGGPIGLLIFWFLNIWREPAQKQATS